MHTFCHAIIRLSKHQRFDENYFKISPTCSGELEKTCLPSKHSTFKPARIQRKSLKISHNSSGRVKSISPPVCHASHRLSKHHEFHENHLKYHLLAHGCYNNPMFDMQSFGIKTATIHRKSLKNLHQLLGGS